MGSDILFLAQFYLSAETKNLSTSPYRLKFW